MRRPLNVLLVEDDPVTALSVSSSVQEADPSIKMAVCGSLHEAEGMLAQGGVNAVLLDLTLPDCSGVDGVRRIQARHPQVPVVVITAAEDETAGEAIRTGAQDFITKPIQSPKDLIRAVRHSVIRHEVRGLFRGIEREIDRGIESVSSVLEDMRRVSGSCPPVTGKADSDKG
jgi:DNA-binding NtrC family response regulator